MTDSTHTPTKTELQKQCEAEQRLAGGAYEYGPWPIISECWCCGAKGYTNGHGLWRFECGAAALTDGEIETPCPAALSSAGGGK